MKKIIKTIFYIASVVQLLISFAVSKLNDQYIYHMDEILGKGEPLPQLTEIVLRFAPGCLLLFGVFFLLGVLRANKTKNETLIIYMSTLFIVELILLIVIGFCYMLPTYGIMYSL